MSQETSPRIDKWLWATRWCKTRSEAADACRSGAVKKGGQKLKPAYTPRVGEIIHFRKLNLWRPLKVTKILQTRVSAKLAEECYEDQTDPEEIVLWRENRKRSALEKVRGQGRPTKKDRRERNRFFGE
ncbi:MAG: RNA-binding S4 domain-containing protein [Opitutales bacterium]|nr:RNA-binding S4 domain-containing protein [Opitutales bacterium]